MCNNSLKYPPCFLAAIIILACVLSVSAESPARKTYQDYYEWHLLPKSIDLEDENVLAGIQHLVDEGEAGHEAMLAIVKECEDTMLAKRALSILRQSSGDKEAVLKELKQIFATRLPHAEGDDEWLMSAIAQFIADFGTEDDVLVLLPMLEHPNIRMRYLGARYLGQGGGQRALEALKQVQGHDANKRVNEEIGKAISAIEARQAEKEAAQDVGAGTAP